VVAEAALARVLARPWRSWVGRVRSWQRSALRQSFGAVSRPGRFGKGAVLAGDCRVAALRAM